MERLFRPEMTGDADLVRAAIAGDREAFGMLYSRFARAVHGTLLARLPPEDAEDEVQEVFLQAMKHLRDLREPAAFAGWICAIARRRAAGLHRRAVPTEELSDAVASSANPALRAEVMEVLAAIRALPAAYHETLVLRLVEGLSGVEIAAVTDLSPESVRVNLHRGFRLLRERLGLRNE